MSGKPSIWLISIFFFFFAQNSISQNKINSTHSCDFIYGSLYSDVNKYLSSADARKIIDNITSATGLNPNFEVFASNTPNAAAVIEGRLRYVLYNSTWIDELDKISGTPWATISVLAHEIGHHLNGHTLDKSGSKPPIELEADHYSGFILQKLGATKDQALTAMRLFGSEQGSKSHPPKQDRLAAISQGWVRSCSSDKNCDPGNNLKIGHDLATEGEMKYKVGQIEDAKGKFQQAALYNNGHAQSRMGDILLNSGDKVGARKYYFMAAGNNVEHAVATLGELHYENGEKELAEQWLERALNTGHAVSRLGDIAKENGNIMKACQYYEKAMGMGVNHALLTYKALNCNTM